MVAIPARYVSMVKGASKVTGLPTAVIAAQINEESGFTGGCSEVSSAGAVGIAQFLPSTFSGEGCKGSPCNDKDAFICYGVYMYRLLKEEHGSVRNALAAYNAGPGNLAAGYGYADTILSAAGQSPGLQVRPGQGPTPGSTGPGGGGGTGPGSGTTPATLLADSGPDCAFSVGGEKINFLFGIGPTLPSACLISKSELRGALGGLLIIMSSGTFLLGIILLAAYGLKSTGALGKAANVAAVVPGGQGLAAGLQVAQGRASQTGADALAARRAAKAAQRRGQDASDAATYKAYARNSRLADRQDIADADNPPF